jgi:hypothetical protein
LTGAPATEF